VNTETLRQAAAESMQDLINSYLPADRARAARVMRVFDEVSARVARGGPLQEGGGMIPIEDLIALKATLQRHAYPRGVVSDSATADTFQRAYSTVVRVIDDAVEASSAAAGQAGRGAEYQQARQAYGIARRGEQWAARRAGEAGRMSAGDVGVGALEYLASGHPLRAAGVALLARQARAHEAGATATIFDRIARIARTDPSRLGRWAGPLARAAGAGSTEMAATYYTLYHSDPEFRAEVRKMEEE
jgi:hypothetical protein